MTLRIQSDSWIAGRQDSEWISFLKKWLGLSLALHLIAGVMSVGFYDMDEHFQIMEFVSYKLGGAPLNALAFEYSRHLRSFFQPALYEFLARICILLGIHTPSVWAAVFRVFSSLVGWLSLLGMSLCSFTWFNRRKYRELAVKLAALLYFMPYLQARPSAESLGGSCFFLGIALFFLNGKNPKSTFQSFFTGLLFGLSFMFRFQMGFAVLGFGIWGLFVGRVPFPKLVSMFIGIVAACGLGVLTDHHAYGIWTFTAFDYFYYDIIQHGAAISGEFPWWAYFRFLNGDVPLLGNLILSFVVLGWIAKPKHPLTLPTALFFFAHVMAAHKEPRYLFPLIAGVPILIALGTEWVSDVFCRGRKLSAFLPLRWGRNLAFILNLGGLLVATVKPAAVQPLFQSYVFKHQDEIKKLTYIQTNPFEVVGLQMYFYRPPGLEITRAESFSAFEKELKSNPQSQWLAYVQMQLPTDAGELVSRCQFQYTVFPDFLKPFLFLPGLRISSKASLFKCAGGEVGR
jgi:phosphatidylinositol glycan class B